MVSSRATVINLASFCGHYTSNSKCHHDGTKKSKRHRHHRQRRRRSAPQGKQLEQENFPPAGVDHEWGGRTSVTNNYNNEHIEEISINQDLQNLVALDCEMVGVGPGGQRSVLARVSIISGDGSCLLDTFVRVHEKVTDYRSWVSGINPGDLCGPLALDFGLCREKVKDLLRGKILVGHGLNNDLKALALTHPWHLIRDTAHYEPFMWFDSTGNARSPKLRQLAKQRLGRIIQEDGSCHDSCVDARTALELYLSVRGEWEHSPELKKFQCGPRSHFNTKEVQHLTKNQPPCYGSPVAVGGQHAYLALSPSHYSVHLEKCLYESKNLPPQPHFYGSLQLHY